MDRLLYIAATGARELQLAQGVHANNLANVSTTGFQADLTAARAQPVFGHGHPSRVFAQTERPGIDHGKGSVNYTGRSLDVAINGQGWLAVQAPDGAEAYTRAGDLQVAASGLLLTGTGLPVLGDAGPIVVPDAEHVGIGADGTVSVRALGQQPNGLVEVGRLKLVSPDPQDLEKGEDGLLRLAGGGAAPASAEVSLISGALEHSNVNAVGEMLGLIQASRQYEFQVKLMETARENDAAATRLMQLG